MNTVQSMMMASAVRVTWGLAKKLDTGSQQIRRVIITQATKTITEISFRLVIFLLNQFLLQIISHLIKLSEIIFIN
jgi:hypothetical protein